MSNKYAPPWFDGWKDKYQNVLVEGLTDGPTYVRLARKECPMLDVELALRPFTIRATEDQIAVMAKLAVFPVKDSIKAAPASAQVMIGWLAGAYPNLDFPKKSEQRVGTLLATLADAPMGERNAFMAHWSDSDLVDRMLNWVEEQALCKIEDRKVAARAIKEAYGHWLEAMFPMASAAGAFANAKGPVGVDSGTLKAGGDNVLAFGKKTEGQLKPEDPQA